MSPPEASLQRRYGGSANMRAAVSRPFPNAKIVRNSDITNFLEQKMSLSPLLKKRGSLGWQKRLSLVNEVSRASSDKKSLFPNTVGYFWTSSK